MNKNKRFADVSKRGGTLMKQGALLHNDTLRAFVRKRRLTALTIYGIFALIQAVLVVWLVQDFRLETQFSCFLIEILACVLLYRVVRRLSLFRAFSPLREGVVVSEMIEQTTVPEIPFAKCQGKQIELMFAKLVINANGRMHLIELKQIDQKGLFQAGDRVVFSGTLAAPILINRIPTKYACPFCGAIFPLVQETTACSCGHAVLLSVEEQTSSGL